MGKSNLTKREDREQINRVAAIIQRVMGMPPGKCLWMAKKAVVR